jgi:hypothetical protein
LFALIASGDDDQELQPERNRDKAPKMGGAPLGYADRKRIQKEKAMRAKRIKKR